MSGPGNYWLGDDEDELPEGAEPEEALDDLADIDVQDATEEQLPQGAAPDSDVPTRGGARPAPMKRPGGGPPGRPAAPGRRPPPRRPPRAKPKPRPKAKPKRKGRR